MLVLYGMYNSIQFSSVEDKSTTYIYMYRYRYRQMLRILIYLLMNEFSFTYAAEFNITVSFNILVNSYMLAYVKNTYLHKLAYRFFNILLGNSIKKKNSNRLLLKNL